MLHASNCADCGERLQIAASVAQVRWQNRIRERFVFDRLDHRPEPGELMDLTRFMHGGPARLLFCANCGTAQRDESAEADYAADIYDLDLLKHLYPRYLAAFQHKQPFYRALIRPHADVLELGSHLGAFLEAAETWCWKPTGIDVGHDTSSFARERGLRVIREELQDANIPAHSQDAVFIWNCFEQLDDAPAVLRAARQVLKGHGLLTVRVPNFALYQRLAPHAARNDSVRQILAYNNLLGFPYQTGYTPASLSAILKANGFEPISGLNSHLLTAPYPEVTPEIERESREAFSIHSGTTPEPPHSLHGPWIEMISRKSS